MIHRFQGDEGQRRLIMALCRQILLEGDIALATLLASIVELREYNPGQILIEQGNTDSDLYFIISGCVSIIVNGREIATRSSGNHVGEMALIDPTAKRSATVAAIESTVVAVITEPNFTRLSENSPKLWRNIAIILAERLRQREKYVKTPNARPVMFIGSSAETLEVARAIRTNLSHDNILVTVWTDGIFTASSTTIESLLKTIECSDFAILILGPDDTIISRGSELIGPRDNVIFELGLFMGALGRIRTIIVKERKLNLKLPSDLLGVTLLEFAPGESDTLIHRIAPVCDEVRRIFKSLNSK